MRGDLDFETLIHQQYAALFRFAMTLTGSESEARDFTQEVFLVYARKGHQLDDPTKVKSWLFTSLYRLFLGRRRHTNQFVQVELDQAEAELPEVPPVPPTRDDWERVVACLNRLDETFRGPVALFYLEDCSYAEIGTVLGIPLGTVKSRIARGLAQLQKMMLETPLRTERGTKNL